MNPGKTVKPLRSKSGGRCPSEREMRTIRQSSINRLALSSTLPGATSLVLSRKVVPVVRIFFDLRERGFGIKPYDDVRRVRPSASSRDGVRWKQTETEDWQLRRWVSPLRRTLSIEPENDGARRSLAVTLVGSERFREATREIAQLLARAPRDAGLLELTAQSLMPPASLRFASQSVIRYHLSSTSETH